MRLDERLKSLRKGEGITQKELAEAINVSIQSINKWENAKGLPDAVNLLNIACYYKVSLDYLMAHEVEGDLKSIHTPHFKNLKKYIKLWFLRFLNIERN
ncbi:helix-turn-helix domain-containing protein [Mammaliicoccus sciuri]|uniref:helix-turn-helix domain-containing protein n=1 Tax=Mammaliicoccus sciuri TaxID=1296 RepID=UPI001E486EE5|nr:helix-turn-helix transcriptional regulator [Mammaliicoccus sciuri]MCD8898666.1 helix-turn-helix domain-containing protein [Mammaliicoccus sciuri]MCD8913927.1 helix-turn-helix domain-containing protein [Mammaliicoccus sciuri]